MKISDMDGIGEKLARRLAGRTSRRSMISRVGTALVAAPLFPLLPVDRMKAHAAEPAEPDTRSDFQKKAQTKDDTECNYWRYCAIDGSLCTCCGGTTSMCPPGTQPSLTSWVGTCLNPDDKRLYLIAYRDCCGTSGCGRCRCDNTEEATPAYRPSGNNEIIWCFGTSSMAYHCSTAALVGVAS
ncbi:MULTISPECIES: methylamine dehydrogenase (amicyanin) small subunit [Edaphosphingomonas]|uniref:Methylamine dehydrogenase (amicyanin) n=2 Tax=Edaphosphingomonas TaxID=3423724 RepID=A0A2T4HNJ9_9SPHN|nr:MULTISPECIES: methylamine dehydrogenase (amicyanin) small subunit [Sphingomonas]MDX3884330.1 methylamine dehydrogenase (amicyanin) small subunit [Sphingomonas sp.]OHT21839.1 Methylamine dehydrogenase light chain precursor [Sphingomonas haloaromaticamans]PTD17336.1 methylamine dehydrogenase (amicyanin) small subunit [Sphingomonas fennica]